MSLSFSNFKITYKNVILSQIQNDSLYKITHCNIVYNKRLNTVYRRIHYICNNISIQWYLFIHKSTKNPFPRYIKFKNQGAKQPVYFHLCIVYYPIVKKNISLYLNISICLHVHKISLE